MFNFLKRLWKKQSAPDSTESKAPQFAFVLLSEARLPHPDEIIRSFSQFSASGQTLLNSDTGAIGEDGQGVLSLRLGSGEVCMVALMPIPVPNGEAEDSVQFSMSSFSSEWKLPPHQAHLMVMLQPVPVVSPLDSLSRFTTVLAAVSAASGAVGIYWGNACATHSPEFFASVAREQDVVPRIMLWTGISMAREKDGRGSLLSLGMAQLSLPDLLLVVGPRSQDSALQTMFDLLAYVATRGEPIREGETVGGSAEQRIPVRYVPSPLDPGKKIWRVEYP